LNFFTEPATGDGNDMTDVRHHQATAFIEAQAVIERVRAAGQQHVLRYWDNLPEEPRQRLLHQLSLIDFDLKARLYREYIAHRKTPEISAMAPAETISLAHQRANPQEIRQMIARGEEMLRAGKIAAVLVAGGQASRLGFDKPKGEYPIGPVSKKSLFQLHAEKLLATARRYGTRIPWYIMTSDTNDGETRAFFEQHDLYGYPPADIFFFEQEMMPALDENGKLILDAPDHIFMNPNGHGGTLTALAKSGALADMRRRGLEEVFYFQVDNVLLQMCDPLFIGYHAAAGADMSAKVCAKRDPHEKVGVIGRVIDPATGQPGKLKVVEYSDMSHADKEARLPDGTLKYNAGSIAIHLFKTAFIARESNGGTKLPWHVAHKQIPYLDANGKLIQPDQPNGYKFETFIFDALSDAQRVVLLEVERRFEFSPVKNAAGEDSPQSAQHDWCELHAHWLEQAGAKIPRDAAGRLNARLEISPLFALDAHELAKKISPDLKVRDGLYLES
jgi:UDP-N-acetylglucosamine/UDP-N-acetylgalactosamine diphosphorylase